MLCLALFVIYWRKWMVSYLYWLKTYCLLCVYKLFYVLRVALPVYVHWIIYLQSCFGFALYQIVYAQCFICPCFAVWFCICGTVSIVDVKFRSESFGFHTSNKLGWIEWLIEYTIFLHGSSAMEVRQERNLYLHANFQLGSLGDEDDVWTSNTLIAQRKSAIPHSTMKNMTCITETGDVQ